MSGCIEYREGIRLYNDGELPPEDRDTLFSHLEHCALCRLALEQEQSLSARVRAARPQVFASDSLRSAVERIVAERRMLEEQPSASSDEPGLELGHKAAAGSGPPPRSFLASVRHWPLLALAAALILVVGSALTWYGGRQRSNDLIIQAAVLAHQQLQEHAVSLDVVADSPEAVTAWFASRVPFPFHMANAGIASDAQADYKLDGGRLLTVGGDRLALVSFHLPHELVSMLVTPGRLLTASGGKVVHSGGIAFHSRDLPDPNQGLVHVVTWNNRGLGYVLAMNTSMGTGSNCTHCHQVPPAGNNATTHATGLPGDAFWPVDDHSMLASALAATGISSARAKAVGKHLEIAHSADAFSGVNTLNRAPGIPKTGRKSLR